MPSPSLAEVDLIMRLYEQRRERQLRRARDWTLSFWPKSAADVKAVMEGRDGKKSSRYLRMAVTYWEMVAAVMMSGAISPEGRALFVETTREFFFVYARLSTFFVELRATLSPYFGRRLEEFARSLPQHDEYMALFEKRRAAVMSAVAKAAPKKRRTSP